MPESDDRFPWWLIVVGVILGLMFVDGCPQDSADTELARTAREAVELARSAQDNDRSAVIWAGRFRLLALILGVGIPLVMAYLIWRSTCTSEVDPIEVIAELERLNPPELKASTPRSLPINPCVLDMSAPQDGEDSPTNTTE